MPVDVTPAAHASRDAYERWHEGLDVDVESDTPWHRMLKAHLVEPRDVANRRVLEIGCGRGGLAVWLARRGVPPAKIVAADFARAALSKAQGFARANGLDGIYWQAMDIGHIAFADASFDTVFSCETIEHVPDPRGALGEIARVLKPAGRLYLTAPNYCGLLGAYRGYLRLRGRRFTEEGQPINNFLLLPLVCAWVRRAGLQVDVVDGTGHYLPFPGRPPIEMPLLNNLRFVTRWAGLHSLIIARKP